MLTGINSLKRTMPMKNVSTALLSRKNRFTTGSYVYRKIAKKFENRGD